MQTLNHEKLIDQLIKVVRMKQANDDAEFIHLFNEVINGKISKIDKQNPKASVGTNFFNLPVPQKLINKMVLPLPYDGGTGMHAIRQLL